MTQVTPVGSLGPTLDRLARVLWPSVEPPGHTLRSAGDGDHPGPVERYAALPSRARPRFLLPLDAPARTRARLLLHYNHLRTDRRRAQRLALAALTGLGLPRPRPGAARLVAGPGPGAGLRDRVADALDLRADALVLSVGVRPGSGPLTPTVTVIDLEGRPRAFVKVADTPETLAGLAAEHDVLADLRQPERSGLLVPTPLFRFVWGEALVVGIEPLPLDVRRVGPDELDATETYLERLVASRDTAELSLADSPWADRLRARSVDLPDRWSVPVLAALRAAADRRGDRTLPHGLRHGDWSSWNMAWSREVGGLAVWDWEFAEPMAPLGLDRCNWHFAYDTSVRGVSMTRAAARLRAVAADGGVDPDLVDLYLLDMTVRRAGQGAEGDEASAAYADELVTLLR